MPGIAADREFAQPPPALRGDSAPLAVLPRPERVVAIDPDAIDQTYHHVVAALLNPDVTVDAAQASAAQLDLLRHYVPPEQICTGGVLRRAYLPSTTLIGACFRRAAGDQESLHRLLRASVTGRQAPTETSRAGVGLPRPGEVGLVALVLVQRALDRSARAMTPDNLRRVLAGFARVCQRARQRASRITHAILYGNLAPDELTQLERTFAGELALVALPGAFFGDASFDREWRLPGEPSALPPAESEILTILVTLQQRYRDALFASGFRSSTLDGAALLGIPSFSFVETRAACWQASCGDGRYLVEARPEPRVGARGLQLPMSSTRPSACTCAARRRGRTASRARRSTRRRSPTP